MNVDTGPIEVKNNFGGEVTIRLYHADAIDSVFAAWHIGTNQEVFLQLNGENVVIGGDWLVDIVFGNGVQSHRHLVWKVATYAGGKFESIASDVWSNGQA